MVENQQNSLLGKIAAYTEILAADPRSTIFVSLSESYRKMGMLDEAYSVATEGLGHLPDYGPGHVVLARIKCQQGDMAGSEASFEKALAIDPDSLAALVGFARLNLLLDNKAKARNLLLTARELSPADSVINKLLLTLPAPEPEPEVEVAPLKAEVVTPVPSVDTLETATLAALYLKQGLPDKALTIYRNLLMRHPDNLVFRRCIRDIELAESGSLEAPAVETNPVQAEIESEAVVVDFASESSASLAAQNIGLSNPPLAGGSVLDQLNSLLTSIQKRRGDV